MVTWFVVHLFKLHYRPKWTRVVYRIMQNVTYISNILQCYKRQIGKGVEWKDNQLANIDYLNMVAKRIHKNPSFVLIKETILAGTMKKVERAKKTYKRLLTLKIYI